MTAFARALVRAARRRPGPDPDGRDRRQTLRRLRIGPRLPAEPLCGGAVHLVRRGPRAGPLAIVVVISTALSAFSLRAVRGGPARAHRAPQHGARVRDVRPACRRASAASTHPRRRGSRPGIHAGLPCSARGARHLRHASASRRRSASRCCTHAASSDVDPAAGRGAALLRRGPAGAVRRRAGRVDPSFLHRAAWPSTAARDQLRARALARRGTGAAP